MENADASVLSPSSLPESPDSPAPINAYLFPNHSQTTFTPTLAFFETLTQSHCTKRLRDAQSASHSKARLLRQIQTHLSELAQLEPTLPSSAIERLRFQTYQSDIAQSDYRTFKGFLKEEILGKANSSTSLDGALASLMKLCNLFAWSILPDYQHEYQALFKRHAKEMQAFANQTLACLTKKKSPLPLDESKVLTFLILYGFLSYLLSVNFPATDNVSVASFFALSAPYLLLYNRSNVDPSGPPPSASPYFPLVSLFKYYLSPAYWAGVPQRTFSLLRDSLAFLRCLFQQAGGSKGLPNETLYIPNWSGLSGTPLDYVAILRTSLRYLGPLLKNLLDKDGPVVGAFPPGATKVGSPAWKVLDEVVLEIWKLFELFADNSTTQTAIKGFLDMIKGILQQFVGSLDAEYFWTHYELVDQEISRLGEEFEPTMALCEFINSQESERTLNATRDRQRVDTIAQMLLSLEKCSKKSAKRAQDEQPESEKKEEPENRSKLAKLDSPPSQAKANSPTVDSLSSNQLIEQITQLQKHLLDSQNKIQQLLSKLVE